jgi:hypothetical protein
MTAAPVHELENPIFQERLGRALDATKDYAHNFRELGPLKTASPASLPGPAVPDVEGIALSQHVGRYSALLSASWHFT